jgi:alpha-galactosidase
MLEVGVDGGPLGYARLTTAESRTQLAMWAMMAAPFIAGNDLSTMSAETARLLTNRGLLAIDQDPGGRPGAPFPGTDGRIWTRTLADGSMAVAFYNADAGNRVIDLDPGRLGQFGCLENVWARTKSDITGHIRANVAAHDTELFRLTADCQLSSS